MDREILERMKDLPTVYSSEVDAIENTIYNLVKQSVGETSYNKMQEFHIELRSAKQVQDFVSLAMVQPFEVQVGNKCQSINGKDLMGMFSLDYSAPVSVRVRCSKDEFARFYNSVEQLIA